MKTRDLTLGAMLLAIALTVFVIENQIPVPIPIPGFKIGLSNIITLITMYLWDKKYSFVLLLVRITISSILCGSGITILYSFSGGVACFFAMLLFKRIFSGDCIAAVSMIGAVVHNTAQLLMAALVLGNIAVFVYFPVLCAIGLVSGLFTGMVGAVCIKNKKILAMFGGGRV